MPFVLFEQESSSRKLGLRVFDDAVQAQAHRRRVAVEAIRTTPAVEMPVDSDWDSIEALGQSLAQMALAS